MLFLSLFIMSSQVAGESGHGKTSFINNLFLSYTKCVNIYAKTTVFVSVVPEGFVSPLPVSLNVESTKQQQWQGGEAPRRKPHARGGVPGRVRAVALSIFACLHLLALLNAPEIDCSCVVCMYSGTSLIYLNAGHTHTHHSPASLCTRFSVKNEATLERMHYAIQDTPGYEGPHSPVASLIRGSVSLA